MGSCPASARYLAHAKPDNPPPIMATFFLVDVVFVVVFVIVVFVVDSIVNFLDSSAASSQFCVCFIRGGVGNRFDAICIEKANASWMPSKVRRRQRSSIVNRSCLW